MSPQTYLSVFILYVSFTSNPEIVLTSQLQQVYNFACEPH